MRARPPRPVRLVAALRGGVGRVLRAPRALAAAFGGLALAGLIAAPGMAPAQDADAAAPLTVVELFTSQGCSSCPPADELLAELAARPDVLALSLHVDYWDYLGWKDAFAMPAFTKRQVAYGEAAGARSVYTPQMIVQGDARMVGSHRDKVLAAVAAAAGRPRPAEIRIRELGEGLEVRVRPLVADAPAGVLWFVTFHNPEPIMIPKGENAGREVAYRNVARSWMKLGRWDGSGEAVYAAPAPSGDAPGAGVAVILQQGYVGPVLAAARLER
ncbi:DUF1223 domain-containing protein [Albimonas sp. CAU 1670]|uniref:DUF1223 domain-containing protein n=1 Tax=Albimonas sp. CAU 1670 TaxID=3032599 RepID=UPI0023DBE221|nr:DUF1223 domain-containing protein [Albimonas sp. CAU 1670]MDF2231328.1 DUF1223 domain-containing protein [Albimonas sp. CAU 1670]